jgi:hypothetical protein
MAWIWQGLDGDDDASSAALAALVVVAAACSMRKVRGPRTASMALFAMAQLVDQTHPSAKADATFPKTEPPPLPPPVVVAGAGAPPPLAAATECMHAIASTV